MKPKLQYHGFSINRPENVLWYLYENQQDGNNALFWYNLSDEDSTTHQFSAQINLVKLDSLPKSMEEMAIILRQDRHYKENPKYEILTYQQEMSLKQGQWCLQYEMALKYTGEPNKIIKDEVFGYICIQPTFEKTALRVQCWQRGLEEEMNPTLREEGYIFISGVTMESEPGIAVR